MNPALVTRIAAGIVDVVERAGGAVTLVHIERQVPGFAAANPKGPGWCFEIEDDERAVLIWDGMSQEGCKALRQVLRGRVAMQLTDPRRYLAEGGGYPAAKNWVPIALAPASMANLQGGERLFLLPASIAELVMQRAPTERGGEQWRRV